jgi:hypothetical protein
MNIADFHRLNRAAKSIEADACQTYYSTVDRYGRDVAGALLIMFMRRSLNTDDQWPASDEIDEKIIEVLKNNKILLGEVALKNETFQ